MNTPKITSIDTLLPSLCTIKPRCLRGFIVHSPSRYFLLRHLERHAYGISLSKVKFFLLIFSLRAYTSGEFLYFNSLFSMRKLFILLFVWGMLTLSGCQKSDNTASVTAQPSPASTGSLEQEPVIIHAEPAPADAPPPPIVVPPVAPHEANQKERDKVLAPVN